MIRRLILAGALLSAPAAPARDSARLSLHDAVRTALENNPSILRAGHEVNAARARVLQEGRIPSPRIGFEWDEIRAGLRPGESNERNITLSQEIEFPTKRSGRVAVAATAVKIAEHRLGRSGLLLTQRVKKTYFEYLLRRETVRHLAEQVRLLTEFSELLVSQYQAGVRPYLDVVRANVETARLNNELVLARHEVSASSSELGLLLGTRSTFELADTLPSPSLPPDRDSLTAAMMERSFSLKIAGSAVVRSEEGLSLARTSYLPDFTIGVAHQRRAGEGTFWGLGLSVSVPVWFWNEPKGRVEEAQAVLAISSVEHSAAARQIEARILTAYDRAAVAARTLESFTRALLPDAEDILTTAITQYRNNRLDVLNVLDVYRTYRITTLEYLRARHGYAVAMAELEVAAELTSAPGMWEEETP